jgi:hypothetical protein
VSGTGRGCCGGESVTYQLTIEQKPAYLHVAVTGRNSGENVVRYMEEVIRECTSRRCFRVLIEERLEGPRLGTVEVFGMVSKGSARFQRTLEAMAYVDLNAEGDVMRFAEDVAVNRGFPVKVFPTVAAAEEWLLSIPDTDADNPHR